MADICPKYTEHGFCIHGRSCKFKHIDTPPPPSQPTPPTPVSSTPSPSAATLVNGTASSLLKTSFSNFTLDDIAATPAFVPSSTPGSVSCVDATSPTTASYTKYYHPTTRMETPARAFIPLPIHMETPSPDTPSGSEICQELIYRQSVSSLYLESKLPDIDNYYALLPIENESTLQDQPDVFGSASICYRAYSSIDGCVYTLRRFPNCTVNNAELKKQLEIWKGIRHSNIVSIHDAFVTKQFGDTSFVVVTDFHAGAQTLKQVYFGTQQYSYSQLDESLLWNFIIQLTAAIRTLHAQKLSCRVIYPSKIMLTGRNRLRVNCVGVLDMLVSVPPGVTDEKSYNIQQTYMHQQKDIVDLGKLVVCLSCNSLAAMHQNNLSKSSEMISSVYSQDVKMLLQHILQKSLQPKKVNDLMPLIGARFYAHIERLRQQCDRTEAELVKELENGRLFRLLCKINSILDRPEHQLDPTWCETGERHILKIFRNYLFHKVDDVGAPWVDLPHILMTLNKLDV
eukprot:sb/3463954/